VSLAVSCVAGVRWRDMEAGRRAGCTTIFIDRDYAERRPDRPDAIVRSRPEAVDWILASSTH
jgi:D-glycero-D-manno-heptose 1,7-bisphosphate phosphatase